MQNQAPLRSHFPELDGLRALAVLGVIFFHSYFFLLPHMVDAAAFQNFTKHLPIGFNLVARGDIGVDLFFVLSAFLLSYFLYIELRKSGQVNYKQFYMRRLWRIYPLYIAMLFLAMLGKFGEWDFYLALLGNLFAYNIWIVPDDMPLPWTWSLSVELHFYALIPLLIPFLRHGWQIALFYLFSLILALGWIYITVQGTPAIIEKSLFTLFTSEDETGLRVYLQHIYVSPFIRLCQFAAGVTGAWAVNYHFATLAHFVKKWRFALLVLMLTLMAVPFSYNPYDNIAPDARLIHMIEFYLGKPLVAIGFALLIVMMIIGALPRLTAFLSTRFFIIFAQCSFSIYLFHPLFVFGITELVLGPADVETVAIWQLLSIFAGASLASLLFGLLTWHGLEKHAIKFGRTYAGTTTKAL